MTRPVRLKATQHEKIWGSTNLEPWFPRSDKKIGEVWFTADSAIPVLVKFLFTSDKLSVQVHPAGAQGKTEMWYILRAEPGAQIALGFREPPSRERMREAAQSGEIESLLRWFPVKPGETYFVPAGTVHAIGAGIALCEIQQNSDITYRLYDYGRPRELHLEQGIAIADLGAHRGLSQPVRRSATRQLLAGCEYFETELIDAAEQVEQKAHATRFQLLVFLQGHGKLDDASFRQGEVWLIPPQSGAHQIYPDSPVRALAVTGPAEVSKT